MIRDYPTCMSLYEEEDDALEAAFLAEASEIRETSREQHTQGSAAPVNNSCLAEFTTSCFRRAGEATQRWTGAVSEATIRHPPSMLFRTAWNRFNRQADFTGQKQG